MLTSDLTLMSIYLCTGTLVLGNDVTMQKLKLEMTE